MFYATTVLVICGKHTREDCTPFYLYIHWQLTSFAHNYKDLSQMHPELLVSLLLNIHFLIWINKGTCMEQPCNGKALVVCPCLLLMQLVHHKSNYSRNMNLVLFCNEFENHCHQKWKVILDNPLKIFLTSSKFIQLVLILHNDPLPYPEFFSLKDSVPCQCNFLPFSKLCFCIAFLQAQYLPGRNFLTVEQ